jgi:hypothetical protein
MYGRLNTVQSFDTGKGDAIRYLDGTAGKLADVQSIGSLQLNQRKCRSRQVLVIWKILRNVKNVLNNVWF